MPHRLNEVLISHWQLVMMCKCYLRSKEQKGQQESSEAILYVQDWPVTKHEEYNHINAVCHTVITTQPTMKRHMEEN